ncbi:hypothetical protein [Pareuzebyella sediminis]|uniref:hypothetical protein n=1 Tax=Pareuzebyella sediminis TaxID=2607998 RepID=UPI0011ED06C0|nr:hypothetical protein [Pareuzebyella sediminis]
MKDNGLKKTVPFLLFFLLGTSIFAQGKQKKADNDTYDWEYNIECYGNTAKQGYKLVKVWSYSKERGVATSQAKKNAVHGIIFKGFTGDGRGCKSSRPLMNRDMTDKEYKDFFRDFFLDDGGYARFVTYATDTKGGTEVQKLVRNKKEKKEKFYQYKIGVVVTVATDELRKHLEKEGIINALAKGF